MSTKNISLFIFALLAIFSTARDFPKPYILEQYPDQYELYGKFPKDFVWGVGTASYQIEGAYNVDGRGASIWDTFSGADTTQMAGNVCQETPCPINDLMFAKGHNGNTADDFYHKFKEDIQLMKSLNIKNFRLSIAWPRILPLGTLEGGINQKGINFYNDVIDELIANGIQPFVTLYHWDLPQALQNDNIQGWLSEEIANHYVDFANICFENFGDRVKYWVTFNEAWTFTVLGYGTGTKAPGNQTNSGNWGLIGTNPYIAAHNVLIAHAKAVDLYRTKYQATQNGKIGMINNCDWREPLTDSQEDIEAANKAIEFQLAWFYDPIYFGDYPESMRTFLGKHGDRLPKFNSTMKQLLKGSTDFFGFNHYGTGFASYNPVPEDYSDYSYWADQEVSVTEDGLPKAQSEWLYGAGWGLRKFLTWIKDRYDNPDIYVTESGWSVKADNAEEGKVDSGRVSYYKNYTTEVFKAINEDAVNVKGYFAWSLMDNYEWERGYTERFGLVYVDFETQERTLKDSAKWFMNNFFSNTEYAEISEVEKTEEITSKEKIFRIVDYLLTNY